MHQADMHPVSVWLASDELVHHTHHCSVLMAQSKSLSCMEALSHKVLLETKPPQV